jgi:hypothetical protein
MKVKIIELSTMNDGHLVPSFVCQDDVSTPPGTEITFISLGLSGRISFPYHGIRLNYE